MFFSKHLYTFYDIVFFMVNVAPVAVAGTKILSPFDKWNLIIAIVFLAFITLFAVIESVKSDSLFPLIDGVGLRIVGADQKISADIDKMSAHDIPAWCGWKLFSKCFWDASWFRIVFWLGIIISLYFLFVLLYVLKWFFDWLNNTNPAMNLLYAFVLLALLQMLVSLIVFPSLLAGATVVDDKPLIMSSALESSYPFHGLVKLVRFIFDSGLFNQGYLLANSDVARVISDIPSNNVTLNYNATGLIE